MDTSNGRGSIADLIQAGRVSSYDCSTFEKAELLYWALVYKKIPCDYLVVDELSTLVTNYVQACTIDPDQIKPEAGKTLWSMRSKMRTNQDVWNIVNYGMRFLITGIRQLPFPSMFCVHEVERDDPTAESNVELERSMPSLPPKILVHTMALSDLVMRLYKAPIPFAMNGQQYAANTRVLQLVNTANAYTGVRLIPDVDANLVQYIPEPTLAKLATAIGHLPKAMTVYGFPKVGKTVFANTLPAS
jgi:hypothetical protein